jgi:thioredoxin-related protein
MRLPFVTSLTFITALTVLTACDAQTTGQEDHKDSPVKWMSFEEAVSKSQASPKKMFIDVYTSWCGWCKKMDASTFSDPDVAKYINENFYPVKLNAETRDTIRFMDKQFKYIPEYKANEIALSLLGGKMGYPSYVFLDESFALLGGAVQGYQEKNDMMAYLTFFAGGLHGKQDFETYRQQYLKESGKGQ